MRSALDGCDVALRSVSKEDFRVLRVCASDTEAVHRVSAIKDLVEALRGTCGILNGAVLRHRNGACARTHPLYDAETAS